MTQKLPTTDRSLPIALIRARENIMFPIRKMLAASGITEQQWRILRVLSEHGPQDATKVSVRACLLVPSLTRIVRTMSGKGLITRTKHETDGRRQMLAITAKGQKIIDDNLTNATRIVEDIKQKIGAETYEMLLDILSAIAVREDSMNDL